jgi:hypothetical protein
MISTQSQSVSLQTVSQVQAALVSSASPTAGCSLQSWELNGLIYLAL